MIVDDLAQGIAELTAREQIRQDIRARARELQDEAARAAVLDVLGEDIFG